jgi:glyoxylase I family protein
MRIVAKDVTPLLQVFDMEKSVAFYRDLLGFAVVNEWRPDGHFYWAMLKLGGAVVMLNAKYEDDQRPPTPDARANAVHADITLYFDCADVDGAYAFLRDKGVDAKPPAVAHYGMKQLYLKDPDGFELCFQQPVKP